RRHHMALGVYDLAGGRCNAPDEGDLAALDPDVGAIARQAGAVDHHAVLDDEVVAHHGAPLGNCYAGGKGWCGGSTPAENNLARQVCNREPPVGVIPLAWNEPMAACFKSSHENAQR